MFGVIGFLLVAVVVVQLVLFHFYCIPSSTHGENGRIMSIQRQQIVLRRQDPRDTNTTIASQAQQQIQLPFQGVYHCKDLLESYGAAWLTTKSRFLTLSQHPYKTAMRGSFSNWTLANVHWGKPDSMEVGSELVLKGGRGALRTVDALEFSVEHLSGYSKFLRHDQKKDGTDWTTQEMIRILKERINEMQTTRTTIELSSLDQLRRLADRVLVVLPFHAATGAAIFGGVNTQFRGKTGDSYTATRRYFLQATLMSLSPLFNKIAVFVENQQDYDYCRSLQGQGFNLMEINLLDDIPDNRFLPEATVYEVERRMVQLGGTSHSIPYGDFEYVYFSEADQILRLRPHQLGALLAAAANSTINAVVTPHRLAPIPHPQDFEEEDVRHHVLDAIGTSRKKFGASKFWAMGQMPVVRWKDNMDESLRCCMDPRDDGTNHHRNWAPLMSMHEDASDGSTAKHVPITLLNVGPYHVVNGDADLWKFEWRTCHLERSVQCSTLRPK